MRLLLLWTHFIGSKLADYSLYWIFAVVIKLNIETFSGWIFKVPGRRNFTYASLKQQIRFQTMWIILYNTIQLYATHYPDRVLVEWIPNPWFFSWRISSQTTNAHKDVFCYGPFCVPLASNVTASISIDC